MSTAEKTAIDFYNTYHLAAMPSEVKRHLMILLLKSPLTKEPLSYIEKEEEKGYSGMLAEPEPFTMEEINRRLDMAEADMQAGRTMSCESVHERMEQKFPWLCESSN